MKDCVIVISLLAQLDEVLSSFGHLNMMEAKKLRLCYFHLTYVIEICALEKTFYRPEKHKHSVKATPCSSMACCGLKCAAVSLV